MPKEDKKLREKKGVPSDRELLARLKEYLDLAEHPDMISYRDQFLGLTRLTEGGARYLWWIKYLCRRGRLYGCRILDVGCGFGWDTLAVALYGGNKMVACDILPSMIEGMSLALGRLYRAGTRVDIEPVQGDICTKRFEPRSFDAIVSAEAVEHIHDLEPFFDQCTELLRPGGRLLISNDSNVHNRRWVRGTLEFWEARDRSPERAEALRALRPVEHADARPYHAMREEIIARANPSLRPEDREAIASATAGLVEPDIKKIAANYQPGGPLPVRPTYAWCRNPTTGEYAERLLDPFELASSIRSRGLRTRIYHGFRRFPLNLANSIQLKPLQKLLFNVRAYFLIVAVK